MLKLNAVLQIVLFIQLLVSVFCDNFEKYTKNVTDYSNSCGGIFQGDEINIRSPNYPKSYPKNLVCYYHIKNSPCTKYYRISFLDFDIGLSDNCARSNLEIENHGRLCGKKNGTNTYFGFNGTLNFKFTSNDTSVGRGFNLLITRVLCKNNVSKERMPTQFKAVSNISN